MSLRDLPRKDALLGDDGELRNVILDWNDDSVVVRPRKEKRLFFARTYSTRQKLILLGKILLVLAPIIYLVFHRNAVPSCPSYVQYQSIFPNAQAILVSTDKQNRFANSRRMGLYGTGSLIATNLGARDEQNILSDVYIVNADGTGLHAITQFLNARVEAWSPDGKWIAFTNYIDKTDKIGEIYVGNADGSTIQNLTPDAKYRFGLWSPDSKKILVADDAGHLFVVIVATAAVRPLTNNMPIIVNYPEPMTAAWSPDNRSLVYEGRDNYLYSIDEFGHNIQPITKVMYSWPQWTQDGKYIIFEAQETDERSLFEKWLRLAANALEPAVIKTAKYAVDAKSLSADTICRVVTLFDYR